MKNVRKSQNQPIPMGFSEQTRDYLDYLEHCFEYHHDEDFSYRYEGDGVRHPCDKIGLAMQLFAVDDYSSCYVRFTPLGIGAFIHFPADSIGPDDFVVLAALRLELIRKYEGGQ